MANPISIVVSPIVKRCIDEAITFSKEKYASIAGVKTESRKLGDKLRAIQAVLNDAEDMQEQLTGEAVKDWLGNLRDAACDAEDTVDDFRTEACVWKMKKKLQQAYLFVGRIKNKSKAANNIKRILDRLEKISRNKKDYTIGHRTQMVHPPVTNDGDFPRLAADRIVGRDEDKAKIIEMLLAEPKMQGTAVNDLSIIPIIGMGGVGKSTLCQLVIQDERVIGYFYGLIIWVRVTEVFDLKRIFKEIMIGCQSKGKSQIDVNSLSLNQLEVCIQDILAGRRFLLVLDDVWTENFQDWESLKRVLNGEAGSKVLITSRSSRVAEIMGTQKPYYVVNCLRDEEARSLFHKIAYKDQTSLAPDVRENIEREIVKMCDGLPLAVKAVGGMIRGTDIEKEWKKIRKYEMWEIEKLPAYKDNLQVLPKLRRSYRRLPSHLKQCFTYCSIFPKGYVFDKKELVKLWMAEGFFVNNDKLDRPEDSGLDYFDELLARSFFQPANIDGNGKYKMHGLIHDLALSLSSPYCFQAKDNGPDIPDESRHLSLLCDNIEDSIIKVTKSSNSDKLRTLLLFTESSKNIGNDVLRRMFRSMKKMRVLALSSCTLQVVPESIQKMKLLRYLNLSKTGIKELPNSLCTLYNLQILILLECKELSKLPDKFHNLVNLQHLDLDDEFWDNISDLPSKMGELTKLQNLRKFIVGMKRGHGIEELKNMSYLSRTLHIAKLENGAKANEAELDKKERLEKLILEWEDKDRKARKEAVHEKTLEDLKPHENLKELHILNYRGSKFPDWITVQRLVVVCLKHCDNCKVLRLAVHCLKELNIEGMQNLEEWRGDECPQLTQLRIRSCPKLHSLPSTFPKLTDMEIIKCDSLGALPSSRSLKHLTFDNTSRLDDWKEKNPSIADSCHVELKQRSTDVNRTLSASEMRSTAAPWYRHCV